MPDSSPLSAITHWRTVIAAMFIAKALRQLDRASFEGQPDSRLPRFEHSNTVHLGAWR